MNMVNAKSGSPIVVRRPLYGRWWLFPLEESFQEDPVGERFVFEG